MDVSSEYIKMCERAEEIQKGWRPYMGDFLYCPQICTIAIYSSEPKPHKDDIWLPRQDQLQERALQDEGLQTIIARIYRFSTDHYGSSYTINGTMEQLWLAFVMKEKYGKVWDGTKWVEEEEGRAGLVELPMQYAPGRWRVS